MRRRTRRCPIIQSQVVVIGVDIAKDDNVAVAQFGDGATLKPLKFKTSAEGFEKLLAFAERASRMSEGFVIALEPTGHYGWPLLRWLQARGVEVFRVEPLHVNRMKELIDGTRRKTDAKDAVVIADLCRQGRCGRWRVLEGPFAELRVLSRRRQQLVKQQSQCRNRLHRHVDEVFPELRRVFSKLLCATGLALLAELCTPEEVLATPEAELEVLLRRASRGQLGLERAKTLRAVAERSVGSRDALSSHRLAIRQTVTDLSHLRSQLREIEQEMERQLMQVPYARRLLSVPKLGVVTAATLLGELGDLRDFDRAAKLIKMAGLDLVEHSSGKRKGRRHISRRGRAYARQMLYLAALRMGNGALAGPRRRMVEQNKIKPAKAAIANACRLLRILHALVRDDVDFDTTRYAVQEVAQAA